MDTFSLLIGVLVGAAIAFVVFLLAYIDLRKDVTREIDLLRRAREGR